VDTIRAGRALRAIREHKSWTLQRAAAEAGISASTAWRIEAGRVESVDGLNRYARGLGAHVDVYVRWHGGDLDRVINRRHGAMHERMARLFEALPAWQAIPEASFSVYGERGVVDWVAWHAETRTLLIVELKSQIVDVQDLLGTMNRRMRLATQIAAPYGWAPAAIGAWVVVEDDRTNRRHVANHAAVLRAAFPDDGRTVRPWLRRPDRPLRCLSFLPVPREVKQGHDRGRRPAPETLPNSAAAERLAGFRPLDPDVLVSG